MLGRLLVVGLIPLVVGSYAAERLVTQPAVGLIRLETDIWSGSADLVRLQIAAARADPAVRAVVFHLDSPGGEVAATQSLYLELLSLRRTMPVVTSIEGLAASGGYYAAMATDPIYAKPSSTVGNVGVWGFVPPDLGVNEVILASGPFKLTASNREEFQREIEGIRQEFHQTVLNGRLDSEGEQRMVISEESLSQGLAYPGREARRLGLVDRLGSLSDAVEEAAQLAGIANYAVIDLQETVFNRLAAQSGDDAPFNLPGSEAWTGAADPVTGRRVLAPGIYLLYDVRLGGGS
ncbi:MAG: S49 family peptidase [Anaerolineae bacterium]